MTADESVRIGRLAVTFEGAGGHEHRVRPIVNRAMAILQELAVDELTLAGAHPGRLTLDAVSAPPVQIDLARDGDETVARALAQALLAEIVGVRNRERPVPGR